MFCYQTTLLKSILLRKTKKENTFGSGGIRTHASEETGA